MNCLVVAALIGYTAAVELKTQQLPGGELNRSSPPPGRYDNDFYEPEFDRSSAEPA